MSSFWWRKQLSGSLLYEEFIKSEIVYLLLINSHVSLAFIFQTIGRLKLSRISTFKQLKQGHYLFPVVVSLFLMAICLCWMPFLCSVYTLTLFYFEYFELIYCCKPGILWIMSNSHKSSHDVHVYYMAEIVRENNLRNIFANWTIFRTCSFRLAPIIWYVPLGRF